MLNFSYARSLYSDLEWTSVDSDWDPVDSGSDFDDSDLDSGLVDSTTSPNLTE